MLTKKKLLERTISHGKCRLWIGPINKRTGYGCVWANGRTRQAHVVSYELHHGIVENGQCVMHSCDERACIEPSHLSIGTRQQNTDDMIAKGRDKKATGIDHALSKLTPEIVAIMRARFIPYDRLNGASALAREFGVTQGTVWSAINMRTWK